MFLLDTNAVSELVRRSPDPGVVAWFKSQPEERLFLSSITLAELQRGVAQLPIGERRAGLERWMAEDVTRRFSGRLLGFGAAEALVWGDLAARLKLAGTGFATMDAQIAAIALAHGLAVVTRNMRHFEPFGVALVNPWAN
jgi:predicted nucleic acid-binding protein